MDVDIVVEQIMEGINNRSGRFNLEVFLRDALEKSFVNNQSTNIEVLRQRTEEVDAFRQSAEFWRGEYLLQAAALDSRRVYLPVDN